MLMSISSLDTALILRIWLIFLYQESLMVIWGAFVFIPAQLAVTTWIKMNRGKTGMDRNKQIGPSLAVSLSFIFPSPDLSLGCS